MPEAVERWRSRLTPERAGGHQTYVLDEGSGEPVVLLHGIPTHSYLWRDVAEVLSLERRAIAPDLLGFGFADRPGGAEVGPAAQARFIEGVLDELGVAASPWSSMTSARWWAVRSSARLPSGSRT